MVRFIPLFIYLYIYLLISFFLEQKQANIGLGQWGYEGVGQGGGERQSSNIIDYTGMCLSEQGVKITHFLCPEEVTIPKQGLFPHP